MAREGQHTAQVKFEGDAGSGVKAAKQLAASIDKLEKKVATLEAKNNKMAKSFSAVESKMQAASRGISRVTNVLGAAGLVGVAIGAAKTIDNLAQRSLAYGNVMNNLPFSIDAAKSATFGLVGSMELATAANKAAQFGVAKTDKEFARLAKAATVLGQSVGQGAAKSVDDLTIALARGSPKILDNLGIQLSLSQAAEEWAAQNDRTVESLSAQEKQLAFQEIGLQKAIEKSEKLTTVNVGLAASWVRAKNNLSDFADELLVSVDRFATAQAGLGAFAETLNDLDRELFKMNHGVYPEQAEILDASRARFEDAANSADQFTQSMKDQAQAMGMLANMAGETFGSDILAFTTSREAMDKSRRIGTKAAKPKSQRSGRRKKKKSDQEELDELLSGADMKSTGDALGGLDEIMDDEIRLQEEAFERGVVLAERRLQLAEETGQGVAMARDRELAAEMALAEWRVENAGTFEEQEIAKAEVEQINHERKLIQIDQQIQAEKDLAATREFVARQSMKLAGQTAGVIGQAADLGIISQRKAAAAAATAAGVQSLVQGFLDSGKAASAFASFNYVQGALYASSASLNFISAGLSFAQAAKMGGSGGGGGRRSTTISAPRGTFGGGSDREGDQGLAPSGAPPTGNSGGGAPAPQQPGVGTQIVVQGDVNGSVDKDFIMNIDRKRRDLGRERKLAG